MLLLLIATETTVRRRHAVSGINLLQPQLDGLLRSTLFYCKA